MSGSSSFAEGARRLLRPALEASTARAALGRFFEGVYAHSGRRLRADVALLLLRRSARADRQAGARSQTMERQEPVGQR